MTAKPALHLAGPKKGAPSFEDLMAMFKKVAGRDPSPQELKEAREAWEK